MPLPLLETISQEIPLLQLLAVPVAVQLLAHDHPFAHDVLLHVALPLPLALVLVLLPIAPLQ